MTTGFPQPGKLFEGRYRLHSVIGQGGFARVYLAEQEDLGRKVAIKLLMPGAPAGSDTAYTEKLIGRFNQEARVVSRLRDPHTITMYDHGRTESGLLYMVFEYVDGDNVSEVLESEGRLEPERVAKILQQTLSSLQEAHTYGVMHRDIKPGNIMVFEHIGRPDQVKLLDFGIAKPVNATKTQDLTADGALVGTPRYMSPEQIRGEDITPQSDIYSLGLVAYEMLVGSKAISSDSSVTIIGMQLDPTPFRLPPDLDIPDGLRNIVDRMLEKETEKRFSSAAEVIEALETWGEGGDPMPGASTGSDGSRGRMVLVAGALMLIALTGVAVVSYHALYGDATDSVAPDERAPAVAVQENRQTPPTEETTSAPEKPVAPVEERRTLTVRTTPSELPVLLGDREVGKSPVEVEVDESLEFPIEVRARLDEETAEGVTLHNYQAEVDLDLSDELARRVAEKERARKKSRRDRKRDNRKAQEKKKEDLVIPALDL